MDKNKSYTFTGSIAHSAKRRYLNYSEADFEGFRLLRAKLHPIGATIRVCRTPKLKFLLRFDQNVECKRPAGAWRIPCAILTKFAEFVPRCTMR